MSANQNNLQEQVQELRSLEAASKTEISNVATRIGERLDEIASKSQMGIDLTPDIQAAKDELAALHALAQPESPIDPPVEDVAGTSAASA